MQVLYIPVCMHVIRIVLFMRFIKVFTKMKISNDNNFVPYNSNKF